MTAYVLVRTDDLRPSTDLLAYLSQVDATLEKHGARILVQSYPAEVRLGQWDGFITLLDLPSLEQAKGWYDSVEYQQIRALRTGASTPTDVIVDGVPDGHRSADLVRLLGSPPEPS